MVLMPGARRLRLTHSVSILLGFQAGCVLVLLLDVPGKGGGGQAFGFGRAHRHIFVLNRSLSRRFYLDLRFSDEARVATI